MSNQKYANIMMIGRTGTGKSSFLNYLLQTDSFKTGKGRPITQGFETLEFDDVNGIPIRVYDSKGLEVIDLAKIKNDIISYIKLKCNDCDPLQWLHSIFYCVSLKRARFEDTEISFIKEVCESIAQTVHIVITHCDAPDSENVREMERYIRSKLNRTNIRIIKVNSVETVKRNGTRIAAFGREEALNGIFSILWSDMSERIANQYADEASCSIDKIYKSLFSMLDAISDKATTWNAVKVLKNDELFDKYFESISETFDKEIQAESERFTERYLSIMQPLADFFANYSNRLGYDAPTINLDDLDTPGLSDLPTPDFDGIWEKSDFGTRIKQLEETANGIDEKFSNIFPASGQTLTMFLKIHKLVKELFEDLKADMNKKKPSKEEIARKMYQQFIDALQD